MISEFDKHGILIKKTKQQKEYEKLNELVRESILNVIKEQQRPGGLLYRKIVNIK